MTLRRPPAASKVHQNNETTKAKKDDTNIYVLYWGGPPLGVQNLYTFPTPKTGIKQIEQFNMSPGLRKKAQDAQDAVLKLRMKRLSGSVEDGTFVIVATAREMSPSLTS